MSKFKLGDRVLVTGEFVGACDLSAHAVRVGGSSVAVSSGCIRPYTEPDAAHPLDAAVAELGRVTGLSGDDLLTAAKRAILGAARRVHGAGIDLRLAREDAMGDIRRVIGDVMPSVLEHAAALPEREATDDDIPF